MYKLLVVSSNENDLAVIKDCLSEHYILTAGDYIEALNRLDTDEDIALILLDTDIPDTGAFQLLQLLNSDARYENLHTIILTNIDDPENEVKGLRFGAVDYIRKPILPEPIRIRIDLHLELLRQRKRRIALYERSVIYDTIFHQAPIGIAISHSYETNSDDTIDETYIVNPMYEKIIGRSHSEFLKLGWTKITHPDDVEEDLANLKKLRAGEIKSYSMDKRYIRPDGSIVWVHMVVALLTLSEPGRFAHVCLVQDITDRKKAEQDLSESERSKSVLLSHLPGMAYRCDYDYNWTMRFVSDGCVRLTGYPARSLINNKDLSFNDLISPQYHNSLRKEWERVLADRLPFKYEYEIITAGGERKWVLEMGEGIFDQYGNIEALEGIILDISNRKKTENSLRYNNEHDKWTGLLNRRYLENLLKHDINNGKAQKRALVGINLSAMHLLSLTYGFHYSQALIKKVADVLRVLCGKNVELYNTYEYRFVYYIKDYKDKKELAGFCEHVANTLENILSAEKISGCIGVIEIDDDNQYDVDRILKNLLITTEKAFNAYDKYIGICFFDAGVEMQIFRENEIQKELSRIVDGSGGLFLEYEPIIDLKTNQICGFEALARIKSTLGNVPPSEFIPIAEKTKLIIPLGEIILRQAIHFLNELKQSGYENIRVSVNISAIQLLSNDFVDTLLQIVNENDTSTENVYLEITESMFENCYELNRILKALKNHGFKISIDDFGTGYSTLSRLRDLNFDSVKIDKSFVDKLMEQNPEASITEDIISMAHKLGHIVVAEGVEYERQREYLEKFGCDKIQGYLINRSVDAKSAIRMLKEYSEKEQCIPI